LFTFYIQYKYTDYIKMNSDSDSSDSDSDTEVVVEVPMPRTKKKTPAKKLGDKKLGESLETQLKAMIEDTKK